MSSSSSRVTGTVLVVGGSGFIGSAVVDELAVRAAGRGGPAVRVLARRAPSSRVAAVGHVRADLTRPETLRGALAGVEVLVHTAAYVGRDPARCEAVNHRGTLALLDEARRAGVEHVVYVSTASVYGPGPHRGADEQALVPRPASPASMSRLRAERAVLDAGGTVLRPHLVYGVGDEWFIPGLAGLLSGVSVWPAGQVSRSSVIAVRDLARGVAGLACGPSAADRSTVYHAAHPRPVATDQLLSALRRRLGVSVRCGEVSAGEHRDLVRHAVPELSDHQYALLTVDHWYCADRLWSRIGEGPGPGFEVRFAEVAFWYAARLAGRGLAPVRRGAAGGGGPGGAGG
ncbi:NAD-dependent epimerase/dehydratase family protein [Streptomyces sp. CNZ748]|uniref:NAD-dependent epimerase/dehydratase family protein n=1 Tax=Streptomyces sp. CNZ748 TaxID=2885160 RepID=UPI0027DF933F|nr:NAD-dependent epimerase/dehydratase family protein [Streptomyces sp. CNZ748]